jgi:membrane-bound metal-dependent hydrolase YbcI (DUF457 family)
MGRTHQLTGVVAGLALAAAMDATLMETTILAGVATVGSLVPDIDHRNSTITRCVPVLGSVASWLARSGSRALYAATKGRADEDHSGEHRHATHTLAFALAFGALVGLGTALLAGERLGLLVGAAMAAGCFAHCLGDALTLSGCPFLWPVPIRGETWWEIRPPRFLRFRTGGVVERLVVFPACVVAIVLLLPGVWPLVAPVAGGLWLAVVG